MGLLSYKISNSYAYFTNSVIGSKTIEMTYTKPNLDTSGANAPLLSSNMIPVYYDESADVWRKADSTNTDKNYKWYDYDNKMWANAVTVNQKAKADDEIIKNKSVSLGNKYVIGKPYTTFISGGYHVDNVTSKVKITIKINNAGTFGFTAIGSSEEGDDFYDVSVSKNNGFGTNLFSSDRSSGYNIERYSDDAVEGDEYVITASYKKNSSGYDGSDRCTLGSFIYPENTETTYTTSSAAGGTSGQDWTASGGFPSGNGVAVSDSISYSVSTGKYSLSNASVQTISSELIGKYVCPTEVAYLCEKPYKIVEASTLITKVDEYRAKSYLEVDVGTIIPMNYINTMWAWIPRYTYTYFSTSTPTEVQIKFESDTSSSGTISCSDVINQKDSDGNYMQISETCTDSKNGSLIAGTSTYTHPAFWWDKDDDSVIEAGEELTGIWVGKFEVSSDKTCSARDDIAVGSGCNSQTIRPKIIPNATSWRGAMVGTFFNDIYNMRESGNQYGFDTSDETHMMKNMEWGAVAYLSHSKYGRCTDGTCSEVTINNCSKYITGIGADSVSANYSSTICTTDANKYNGTKGKLASTTGNVYGIYDMSGGAGEYMMGDVEYPNGIMVSGYTVAGTSTTDSHSGFTGYITRHGKKFDLTYNFPNKRYYDKYSEVGDYKKGKLGDASIETNGWYNDNVFIPASWFVRGGIYSRSSGAGLFNTEGSYGGALIMNSTRAVISKLS